MSETAWDAEQQAARSELQTCLATEARLAKASKQLATALEKAVEQHKFSTFETVLAVGKADALRQKQYLSNKGKYEKTHSSHEQWMTHWKLDQALSTYQQYATYFWRFAADQNGWSKDTWEKGARNVTFAPREVLELVVTDEFGESFRKWCKETGKSATALHKEIKEKEKAKKAARAKAPKKARAVKPPARTSRRLRGQDAEAETETPEGGAAADEEKTPEGGEEADETKEPEGGEAAPVEAAPVEATPDDQPEPADATLDAPPDAPHEGDEPAPADETLDGQAIVSLTSPSPPPPLSPREEPPAATRRFRETDFARIEARGREAEALAERLTAEEERSKVLAEQLAAVERGREAERREAEDRIAAAEKRSEDLAEQNAALARRLEDATRERDELRVEHGAATREYSEYDLMLANPERIAAVRDSETKARRRAFEAGKVKRAAEERADALATELAEQRDANAALEQRFGDATCEMVQLRAEIATLRAAAAA